MYGKKTSWFGGLMCFMLLSVGFGGQLWAQEDAVAGDSAAVAAAADTVEKPYDGGNRLSFGIKGGVVSAKNFTLNRTGLEAIMGFNIGGTLLYKLDNKGGAYLQLEVLYSRRGVDVVTPDSLYTVADRLYQGTFREQFRYDYIQVPILLKVNLTQTAVHPYVSAGPYVSYLVGSKKTNTFSTKPSGKFVEEEIFTEDVDIEGIKNLDIGMTVGGGLFMPIAGNLAFSVELRYDLGIIPIYESTVSTARNRAFGVFGGLTF
jgi:hypothetical protein